MRLANPVVCRALTAHRAVIVREIAGTCYATWQNMDDGSRCQAVLRPRVPLMTKAASDVLQQRMNNIVVRARIRILVGLDLQITALGVFFQYLD